MRHKRNATCCADKPHYAKDMCRSCWHKKHWRTNPVFRAKSLEKGRRRYHKSPEIHEKLMERSRNWYRNNKEHVRSQKMIKIYGITPKEYTKLSIEQKGLCAICKKATSLCIDHNHVTLEIRGLLCRKCNLNLGAYEDLKRNKLLSVVENYLA